MFLFMMPWGRVGSNLINSILAQHIKRYNGKIYNEPTTGIKSKYLPKGLDKVSEEQKKWWQEFVVETTKNPYIGANISISSLVDNNWFFDEIAGKDTSIIYLDRVNVVKTAISKIRAEKYAKFTTEKYGKPMWGMREGMKALGATTIDADKLLSTIKMIETNRVLKNQLLSTAPGLEITYEDINFDLHAVVCEIVNYLNIPLIQYDITFKKATSDKLKREILNYSELEDTLTGKYLDMLNSDA